jgi:hypothetical protein
MGITDKLKKVNKNVEGRFWILEYYLFIFKLLHLVYNFQNNSKIIRLVLHKLTNDGKLDIKMTAYPLQFLINTYSFENKIFRRGNKKKNMYRKFRT